MVPEYRKLFDAAEAEDGAVGHTPAMVSGDSGECATEAQRHREATEAGSSSDSSVSLCLCGALSYGFLNRDSPVAGCAGLPGAPACAGPPTSRLRRRAGF